jgi:pimeloyl-ACP methyl ester carboxylesterase
MTPPPPKLVLLPGMEGTGTLFADFANALPEPCEAIIVVFPTGRFLSYSQLVDLAQSHAPVSEPFVIVAESFSSPIAIQWAATRPHNLRGLVICAGFASSPVRGRLRSMCSYLGSLLFVLAIPDFAVRFALAGADAPPVLVAAVQGAISSVKPRVLSARIRAILACDARAALAEVAVPLLYIQATQDRLVGPACLAEIRQIRPDAEVAAIAGPHLILQRSLNSVPTPFRASSTALDNLRRWPARSTRSRQRRSIRMKI